MNKNLISLTNKGLFCEAGNFYIDASKKVHFSIITHAHADHARPGHTHYLCHKDTAPILRLRLGPTISLQTLEYGESITLNGVKVSLHPAGHVFGSAQIRVERNGEVWVASGDYKLEDDNVSVPFEPIKCDTFITECTFGLPVYHWPDQHETYRSITAWWKENAAQGRRSIITAYSLGKAQRLFKNLEPFEGPVILHNTIYKTNEVIRNAGCALAEGAEKLKKKINIEDIPPEALIFTPPTNANYLKGQLPGSQIAAASGWMQLNKFKRNRQMDKGFVMSDHADWEGLHKAIEATGAERVIAMHGDNETFARQLCEKGYNAMPVESLKH